MSALERGANGALSYTEVYDYVIVGSGFGGSVSAMRLAEKGYRVVIMMPKSVSMERRKMIESFGAAEPIER